MSQCQKRDYQIMNNKINQNNVTNLPIYVKNFMTKFLSLKNFRLASLVLLFMMPIVFMTAKSAQAKGKKYVSQTCPVCNGTGWDKEENDFCFYCLGTGKVTVEVDE